MKKFLSALLAVVMIASLLPATFMTAAAADGDIVFDFDAFCAANFTSAQRHTEYAASPMEGLTLNTSGTGANAGMLWETSGNALRWNNTKINWQTGTHSASSANANSKVAFDYNVPTAGWYRFSAPWSNANADLTIAVYDIFDNVPSFMGEVKNGTLSSAVHLKAGAHTLLLCAVASGAGRSDECPFFDNFTLTKVDAPTGSVELEGFPTTTLKVGTEITDLTAVVNTNYGAQEFSAYGVNLSAADVKYRAKSGDTDNYLKVTYDPAGIAEVTVAPNTAVGAKGSVPYSIKGIAEGTTDVTFTPVVGGVEQTALATTKTITVLDENIAYDFKTFSTLYVNTSGQTTKPIGYQAPVTSTPLLANFSVDTANGVTPIWQPSLGVRFRSSGAAWNSTDSKSDKAVFNIEVIPGKAGWYSPNVNITGNAEPGTGQTAIAPYFSFYMIAPSGKVTFLGDGWGQVTLNPVYLEVGTNKIVLAGISGMTFTTYVHELKFNKLAAEPTFSKPTVSDIPATLKPEETVSATVSITANDALYQLEEVGMNTTNYYKKAERDTYIKVESSDDDIVEVTAPVVSGVNNKKTATFTVKGLKEGTTKLTFTPVIGGEVQTALETTKTINVVDENIVYDFAEWCKSIGLTANDRHIVLTDENTPAGFSIAEGMTELLKWDAGYLRFESIAASWGSDEAIEKRAPGSRYAMIIDVPEGKAGWYTPQFTYHGNENETGLCSVYHIYNGEATYLGDTVNSGDNYLAPVYLEAGENTIAVAVISNTTGMFVHKLAFTKYEGEQATLTGITVAEPADLTVGETSVAYEITGAMSDGSAMKFPPLGMDTETFHNSGLNTTDYIKVTATPANVVEVNAYSGGYAGMDKYYYEVKAVSEGDVVLSFVPVVDGVAKNDLKVTKTISVTHPNGAITGEDVSIGLTAVANGAVDAGAKALISGNNGIVAGNVNSVAVGTKVTLTASEDSEDYTFLYWYNGNSGKILSDKAEYEFVAGTNIPVYAKFLAKGEELTEYASASGTLVSAGDIKEMPDKPYKKAGYTLHVDATDPVNAEEASVTDADAVYWTKDDKIVSYNITYEYLKWGNLGEPVPVKEGEKSDVPAVVLFENSGAYMLELVNFDGKTIIEKGILFGGSTIDSCQYKAVSTTNAKQFTATGDGEATAYVIYKDGTGYRVAYSD